MMPRAARREELWDLLLIIAACLGLVLLLALLGSLGLPFGLHVTAMGEDYNWLLFLREPHPAAQARAFWAFDGRNPLSPWWYIAVQRVYAGMSDGPFLVRLAVNPLLAVGVYCAVRAYGDGQNRAPALACALVVGLSLFSTTLSQILWNLLGALALSLFSIAAFASWLRQDRRSGALYGMSLCLWFAAFATYLFQVGAILACWLLSVQHARRTGYGLIRAALRAIADTLPFALLLGFFILIWLTTQKPGAGTTFTLQFDLLARNLPRSIASGLAVTRYGGFLRTALDALSFWLLVIAALAGIGVAVVVREAMPADRGRLTSSPWVLTLGCCIVLPTALIESMSVVWTVGTRWPMVDQVWQPLLWLGLIWLVIGLVSRLRPSFPLFAGVAAALAVSLSLGHNAGATVASRSEAALRAGVSALVARRGPDRPLHLIVFVESGVIINFGELMSQRILSAWLPNTPLTIRVLVRSSDGLGPYRPAWWELVLEDQTVRNVSPAGESVPYDDVVFARFDGHTLTPIEKLAAAEVRGYPVEWHRSQPIREVKP